MVCGMLWRSAGESSGHHKSTIGPSCINRDSPWKNWHGCHQVIRLYCMRTLVCIGLSQLCNVIPNHPYWLLEYKKYVVREELKVMLDMGQLRRPTVIRAAQCPSHKLSVWESKRMSVLPSNGWFPSFNATCWEALLYSILTTPCSNGSTTWRMQGGLLVGIWHFRHKFEVVHRLGMQMVVVNYVSRWRGVSCRPESGGGVCDRGDIPCYVTFIIFTLMWKMCIFLNRNT